MKTERSSTSPDTNENMVLGDVFSLFCGTDNIRPDMHKPFELKGKIYATDSITLIRCDKSYCDFEINNPETPPDCERIMPDENCNKVLNIDKSIFDKYKNEPMYKYIGKDVECATCHGQGEVDWEFERHTKTFDCPACMGSGLSEEKKSVKIEEKKFMLLVTYVIYLIIRYITR